MKQKIAIVNYGMGNLRSVENTIKKLGYYVKIVSKPEDLDKFDKIILPGVGAFKKAISLLNKKNWVKVIKKNVLIKKKKILGICLGMQLFATESEEFGNTKGLDLISGKIKFLSNMGCKKKIPHIGWNSISIKKKHKYLDGLHNNIDFYFVNSLVFQPKNNSCIVAKTNHGINFCSIISKNNIFGTQFHPEKSSKAGRRILENFLNA
jgi:imidazole glycerol-phosphate synthase subunit HisH